MTDTQVDGGRRMIGTKSPEEGICSHLGFGQGGRQ